MTRHAGCGSAMQGPQVCDLNISLFRSAGSGPDQGKKEEKQGEAKINLCHCEPQPCLSEGAFQNQAVSPLYGR